jgi:hypothetical protein
MPRSAAFEQANLHQRHVRNMNPRRLVEPRVKILYISHPDMSSAPCTHHRVIAREWALRRSEYVSQGVSRCDAWGANRIGWRSPMSAALDTSSVRSPANASMIARLDDPRQSAKVVFPLPEIMLLVPAATIASRSASGAGRASIFCAAICCIATISRAVQIVLHGLGRQSARQRFHRAGGARARSRSHRWQNLTTNA